jgi:NADH-quinone oxidoreductase subunit L
VMTAPMMVLGVLAVVAGYVNTPWFGTFLGDWLTKDVAFQVREVHGPAWIMIVATLVSLAGIFLAYLIYGKRTISRDWIGGEQTAMYSLLKEKCYIDELYSVTVLPLVKGIAYVLHFLETYIVEGIAKLIANIVRGVGAAFSKLQNGQVQMYGTVTVICLAALVMILLLTGGHGQ